jgi:Flp pilus assembly protein TadG
MTGLKRNPTLGFARNLARFRDDESGNVAMMFGAALVTLLLGVGAAVDVGRWLHARSQTVAAIDAAVLAGGRALQVNSKNKSAAVEVAKKYYIQNVTSRLPVVGDTVNFGVASDGMGITASGMAYIKTPFLNFAGVEKLPLITAAQTEFASSKIAVGGNGGQNVEVSLILDITGSMKGSKLSDLKEAAKDLVNIVIWDDQSEYYSKVALVPYSIGVNVGSSIANTVRGTMKSGTATSPGSANYKFTNMLNSQKTFPVSTCVTERTGNYAYTDDPSTTAKVGTNYHASGSAASSSNPCPTAQLVPLTSNKTTLTNAIDSYAATGSTAGHIGIGWGWYTLSPRWNNVFTGTSAPASYSKLTEIGPKGVPVLKKIAVLMTDGDFNTAYCNGVIAKNSGTGSGADADHINCNATNGTSSDQALQLCAAMKAKGIEVYTVGFDVGDQNVAKNLMNKCATDAGKVYIADNGDQLRDAFRDIALKLSSLYISK